MLTVLSANGPSGYRIANSLRFRSSASAYLSRTPASAGNLTTWTWSGWVKRGAISSGSNPTILSAGVGTFPYTIIGFLSNDTIYFDCLNSGPTVVGRKYSNQVFRDPSSWYHFVFVWDTTNSTASNRMRVYVNGTQITSWSLSTDPALNATTQLNSNVITSIGSQFGGSNYFDGYLSDINFIDGQALTPSSFGETSSTTGVWIPKQYSGSYGTNGFYLKFTDTTSTTALGYDSSGNSNNWTPNNLSLTTGSTYDSMLDSPTNYDNGGTGVGNYCVMNAVSIGSDCTLSDGNLGVAYGSSGTIKSTMATIGMSSGKWYCEFSITGGSSPSPSVGISSKASSSDMPEYIGYNAYGWGYYIDGTKRNNAAGGGSYSYGATWTTGDIIGIAFDADAGTLTFYKNNTSQGTAFTGLTSGPYYFGVGDGGSTATFTAWFNFGQRPFAYTPPSGYKSLCTYNLPTPTIQNGANYMAATIYTGNGSTQSIVNAVNGISFAPDMVWVKNRSSSSNWHNICDIVRGVSTRLASNSTSAEAFFSGYATYAFNSNGFSVGDDTSGQYDVNGSVGGTYSGNAQYVGWQWKAGGTAVTNTAGSITSSVSANTTSGFSVVTLTTQASGTGTFGHGLGVAPSLVITKLRSVTNNWYSYHASVGATAYLELNTTLAATTNSAFWNNTAPTSSVVTLGSIWATSNTMVAYCFAAISGYSAFGSYTGNGSTDGPFVYCGFRPRYVMVKCSSSNQAGNATWRIQDSTRNTYNVVTNMLLGNLSDAESTGNTLIDLLSNGFKLRGTSTGQNASGGTYIYAAFAENPFQNALAR